MTNEYPLPDKLTILTGERAKSEMAGRRVVTIHTPQGPLTVLRVVAEKLLDEHVVSGEIDDHLHANDPAIVKAALMAMSAACDFCSGGATTGFEIPDFTMPGGVGQSTGGWAACDVCADLVRTGKRQQLLDRSVGNTSFSKFTRGNVAELHARFWRGLEETQAAAGTIAAVTDYLDGRLPEQQFEPAKDVPKHARMDRLLNLLGMTARELKDALDKNPGHLQAALTVHRKMKGMKLHDIKRVLGNGEPLKPLPEIKPHWQIALDRKYEAMTLMRKFVDGEMGYRTFQPEGIDLNDLVALQATMSTAQRDRRRFIGHAREDLAALDHAEVYSFNAETIGAIRTATAGVPMDTPLSAIDTPGNGRAGWFWFAERLPIHSTSQRLGTSAMLWQWADDEQGRPELRLSLFIEDPAIDNAIAPAGYWRWRRHETLDALKVEIARAYRHNEFTISDPGFSEESTIEALLQATLFFVMACLWMKQKVAVSAPGHIERHARKRIQREHKLKDPPSVQIIALRKSERSTAPHEPREGESQPRDYHFRFVVQGHPRLQPCGPGRKDVKLIWISSFIKGPDDKPLRTRERVYAVVR